ncbi:hypothetical protein ET445_03350 [Agromyces protaetiae]|uniref:Uncharacterized protein n=1 Tax=Agromyces protaetiae TaxID=2509455 RepID=A0A4P6F8T5_9MICO|nr:hypothetical protein [Agromyces protaetiae]QAY72520.1 hypothetical protein ET445_03350 [Agromyces protaetiae]
MKRSGVSRVFTNSSSKKRRRFSVLLTFTAAAALVTPLAATPAAAEEGDDIVIASSTVPYLTAEPGVINNIIVLDGGGVQIGNSATLPAPQCVPLDGSGSNDPTSGTLCVGSPTNVDPTPLQVGGIEDFLSADEAGAFSALGWLMQEAKNAVAALYDVPADGRLSLYAGDQIRAYMISRILDIADKAVYGVELTANELLALEFVESRFATTDQKLAQWALDEYNSYQAAECGYTPPAAPAFVTEPVGLPQDVIAWCARRHTVLESAFVFAPALPSAAHFRAWAMYRHYAELGLDRLNSPAIQDSLGDTNRAMLALGGIGAAAGAAAVAGASIGASVTASSFVAGAIASSVLTPSFAAGTGASVTSSVAISTVGAAAAAGIVAVVVIGVVITAVSIWQLVEYEEIGQSLRESLEDANDAADDPFGLEELSGDFAGLPIRTGLTDANLPSYRTPAMIARVNEIITGASTKKFSGVYLPDDDTLWADNATTPDDFRFFVTDSAGSRVQDSLSIPVDGVATTVRFSKGWMITDTGDGEKPGLEFGYVDPDGNRVLATRAPASVGGFTLTTITPDNEFSSRADDSVSYLDADGGLVTATLVGNSTSELGGPVPTAVGPLIPGRTVILRPNPVDLEGHFDLDRYATGYDYTWTIQRFDVDASLWSNVQDPAVGYDTRFKPTEVGRYRASVLMHDTDPSDGVDDDVWGLVEFQIVPPVVEALELSLADDGIDGLQVSAQFGAQIPSDDFTVSVQWPAKLDGTPGPVAELDLPCLTIDPMSCSTVRTENFPEHRAALAYTLPVDADTSRGVDVTVTDRFGASTTRHFEIANPARPSLLPPEIAPAPTQSGTVAYSAHGISVQVPVAVGGDQNYEVARIAPGAGSTAESTNFGIVDPATGLPVTTLVLLDGKITVTAAFDDPSGEWVLIARAIGDVGDIGATTIPLVVQQAAGGTRASSTLTVEFLPSAGNRFRAALARDIEPLSTVEAMPQLVPYLIGGQTDWGEYAGDLCVKIEFVTFPQPPGERCGALATFLDADERFAALPLAELYPGDEIDGLYRVSTWLATPGEHVDETATSLSFYLDVAEPEEPEPEEPEPDPTPPTISGFAWSQSTRTLSFTAAPGPDGSPIATYACTIDRRSTPCPDASSGKWSGASLARGSHVFGLTVTTEAGLSTHADYRFNVTSNPQPPQPPAPPQPPRPAQIIAVIVITIIGWLRKLFG